MRQFALYINDEVNGPLSEYEVQDLIHAGKVTAETLCAPVGSENWEPLSNHFSFTSGLKLSRQTNEKVESSTETEPDLPRLEHDTRRRLLMYGLADSASVDQISPLQAEFLIREKETAIRRENSVRTIATFVSIALGVLGSSFLLAQPEASETIKDVANSAVSEDAKSIAQWQSFVKRANEYENQAKNAAVVPFGEPPGGLPCGPILLQRLQVNDEAAYNVTLTVALNNETLVGPLNKFSITLQPKVTLYMLEKDIPGDQLRKAKALTETLQLILSPLLDNKEFEPLRDELLTKFPDAADIPEAARLRADLATLKVTELATAIDKVNFRASEAEKIGEGKGPKTSNTVNASAYVGWAGRLRDFANDIIHLRDRLRINVDPEARRKVWSDFNLTTGAELGAWVIANAKSTFESNEQGEVHLTETANLKSDLIRRRVFVSFRINEDTVFLPWDSAFLSCGEPTSTRISNEVFMARERYKVISKADVGGRRYKYSSQVGDKLLMLTRESPHVYYISVARDRDTDVVTVRVDETAFKNINRGDVIPLDTLAQLPAYSQPAETIPSPLLSPE